MLRLKTRTTHYHIYIRTSRQRSCNQMLVVIDHMIIDLVYRHEANTWMEKSVLICYVRKKCKIY